MCSRYALTSPPEAVRAHFGHVGETSYPPRYNIAPSQPVLIVRHDHARRRELTLVRWGLIPSWTKDPARLSIIVNARAETAAQKPSFRGSLRHRRCLVPADAYYEWTGSPGNRRPHMVRPAAGGQMALAGLWEHWLGTDGSEIETMAILTVPARGFLARLHDRMPVVLPPALFEAWLDTSSGRSDAAEAMLADGQTDGLEVLEVSQKLNNSRNEGPELQEIVGKILI
jgi:putative SOS response-associated peptidase YedK